VNSLEEIAEVEVFVEICREGAVMPSYARKGDAGMDVCAAEDVLLKPGQTSIVPTGLKLAVPEGYEIQIRPRSGISLKTPLRLSNSPGTIDSGYRGELGIIITNQSTADSKAVLSIDGPFDSGDSNGTYLIRKGDRIAQMVLQRVPRIKLMPVQSVDAIGTDRGGGFGSTGTR
jgi:dUTP pyrophosphatase